MSEQSIYPPIEVHEHFPFNETRVKLMGLESENGKVLAAAGVFDVAVENERYPFFTKFDYLNLCPFDQPKHPEHMFSVWLEAYIEKTSDPDKLFNRAGQFFGNMTLITNGDQALQEHVIGMIKDGTKDGKVPLWIDGHGGEDEGIWNVGSGDGYAEGDDGMPITTLLANAGSMLHTVNPDISDDLRDRYSMVILHSCNPGDVEIPQDVVNQMNVPLLYSKGIVVGYQNPSSPVLVHPK